MAKKYYWLRLQKDFFKRHDIRIIEAMPNGKDYILFYLKMLVESVGHEGELRFSDTIPYNEDMLATITNTNVDIVRNAMRVFSELGMIDVLEDATIYMAEVSKMIGSAEQDEHTRASTRDRVRACRERKRLALEEAERYSNVTRNGEIEKEKELEIDKYIVEIMNYFNSVCNTHYKTSSTKTRASIKARLNEGYTVADFKTVIDKKYKKWSGTDMAQYLRPETLFSNKFEGYLNELATEPKKPKNSANFEGRNIDFEALEKEVI